MWCRNGPLEQIDFASACTSCVEMQDVSFRILSVFSRVWNLTIPESLDWNLINFGVLTIPERAAGCNFKIFNQVKKGEV